MKQTTVIRRSLPLILCAVLVAAAFASTGCAKADQNKTDRSAETSVQPSAESGGTDTDEVIEVGEGSISFAFVSVDPDGKETHFTVRTEKTSVADALSEAGLITGEDGPYGLYVKTVNGLTLDYDTDGKYWAFYVDGQYAMTSVEKTEIKEGSVYSFRAE